MSRKVLCLTSVPLRVWLRLWSAQLGVAAYLAYKGELTYAAVLLGLILPQMFFQAKYLLKDPIEYDVKYQVRLHWENGLRKGQAIPEDYCH